MIEDEPLGIRLLAQQYGCTALSHHQLCEDSPNGCDKGSMSLMEGKPDEFAESFGIVVDGCGLSHNFPSYCLEHYNIFGGQSHEDVLHGVPSIYNVNAVKCKSVSMLFVISSIITGCQDVCQKRDFPCQECVAQ